MKRAQGYNLVAVLVALLIFMLALVPLISLQGRLFDTAFSRPSTAYTRWIEDDLETIRSHPRPRSREWLEGNVNIRRKVEKRRRNGVVPVIYQITLVQDPDRILYQGEVWLFNGEP